MKLPTFPMAALEQRVIALSSLRKVLLFLLTFSVLCAGFYFFRYKPQAEKIATLRVNIAKQEKRLAELKRAAAQTKILEAEVAKSQEEFDRMLARLPDQKEIPELLDSISRLAAQAGLENIFFQPQAEQAHDFYAVIPIRLDLVGTYHQLGVFLDSISKLDRIVKIDQLSLSRQKDTSSLQVNCTIVTYRFLEKSEQKEADSKKKQ
jgi:type IV pilus assembly protein PilO